GRVGGARAGGRGGDGRGGGGGGGRGRAVGGGRDTAHVDGPGRHPGRLRPGADGGDQPGGPAPGDSLGRGRHRRPHVRRVDHRRGGCGAGGIDLSFRPAVDRRGQGGAGAAGAGGRAGTSPKKRATYQDPRE